MSHRMIAICVAALLTAGAASAADKSKQQDAPTEYTPAQKLIYMTNYLKALGKDDVVHYTFNRAGAIEGALDDKATVTVTAVGEDGKKNLAIDFLSGENHIDLQPFEGFKLGNPIVMIFLEHDVKEMSDLTKGSTLYFRNRIKDAFATKGKSTISKTSVTVDDHKVDATVLTVEPYVGVDMIDRFRQFEHKSYQFVISEAVPGGLYSIKTVTPGKAGDAPAMVETLAYASLSKP